MQSDFNPARVERRDVFVADDQDMATADPRGQRDAIVEQSLADRNGVRMGTTDMDDAQGGGGHGDSGVVAGAGTGAAGRRQWVSSRSVRRSAASAGVRRRREAQVGDFVVQRRAFGREPGQRLGPIRARQQWSAAVVGQSRQLLVDVDLEIHHEAVLAHQCAVVRVEHRAAATGDHAAFAREHVRQRLAFATPEPGFALAGEDRRDLGAGAGFDLAIQIHEGRPAGQCQAATQRGLAGAHRADQDEVRRRVHVAILTAGA